MKFLNKITMKKMRSVFCVLIVLLCPVAASVTVQLGTAGWGDASLENGSADNDLVWGFVIGVDGREISPNLLSTALVGFTLPDLVSDPTPVNPVMISADYYFIRSSTNSSNSGPPNFQDGYFNRANFNLVNGVTTSDPMGVLWFEARTRVVTENANYGFSPLAARVPGDDTVVTVASSPATMQYQTIPEPGLLGLTGLAALGLLRRRRR